MTTGAERTWLLASAIAREARGELVPVPSAPPPPPPMQARARRAQWAIVLPRGLHAALVVESGNDPVALAWDGSVLRDDPALAARALSAHAERDDATCIELAIAACDRLARELEHEAWVRAVLSGRRMTELHVVGEGCSVDVGGTSRLDAGSGAVPRAAAAARLGEIVASLRAQVQAHRGAEPVARALGELATALVAELNARVPTPDGSAWRTPAADLRRAPSHVCWGRGRARSVAEIALPGRVRIGRRTLEVARHDLAALVDAIAVRVAEVTSADLDPGERYRVIAPFEGLREGEVVRFVGSEWEEDRYEVLTFEDPRGARVVVSDSRVVMALERHLVRAR